MGKQNREVNEFVKGYIAYALWLTNDSDFDISLDDMGYTIDDISDESLLKIIEDCNNFQKQAQNALTASGMDDSYEWCI